MHLIKFGTVNLPGDNGEHAMPIGARSALVDLPNGSFDQDGSDLFLESQTVNFSATVNATNGEVDGQVNALIQQLGKGRNILRARLRDNLTEWVTYAKITAVQRVANAEKYEEEQPIVVRFVQDYPYWMNAADGFYFDTGYYFDAGHVFDGLYSDQSITASPHAFTIAYDGTAKTGMGTITIVPNAASSISNVRVVNGLTGQGFTYTGTLNAADRLIVDFLTKTVELNGANAYANFALDSAQQVDWMELEIGDNNISVYGAGIAGTIKLYWQYKRHYL